MIPAMAISAGALEIVLPLPNLPQPILQRCCQFRVYSSNTVVIPDQMLHENTGLDAEINLTLSVPCMVKETHHSDLPLCRKPAAGDSSKEYQVEIFDDEHALRLLERALHRLEGTTIQESLETKVAAILRGCGHTKNLSEGKRIHAHIVGKRIQQDLFLNNVLIQMYANCVDLDSACKMLEVLRPYKPFSWNVLVRAYDQHEQGSQALALFRQMEIEGVMLDKFSYSSIIDVCSSLQALAQGKQIHAHILRCKRYEINIVIATSLVNMYGKCNHVENARKIFDAMPEHDIVTWTTMIAIYVQNGHALDAFEIFQEMEHNGLRPNKVTFVTLLDACAVLADLGKGKLIHSRAISNGDAVNIVVGTAVVKMYANCRCLEAASDTFDKMPERNVVSWTAIIAAYAENKLGFQALCLFERMQFETVESNDVTMVIIIDTCGDTRLLTVGKKMHALVMSSGFCSDVVGTSLLNMYGKCGSLEDARFIFDKLLHCDVVAWNSMFALYSHNKCNMEALRLFKHMQQRSIKPNKATFVSLLDACACLTALEEGKYLHAFVMDSGYELDVVVATSLVNLYGKCGRVDYARNVFAKLLEQDIISWTAMIAACSQNGYGREALELFQKMEFDGVAPNEFTYVSILEACAGLGAIAEGQEVHASVVAKGIDLDVFVSTALVNMYGKCGHVEGAREVFDNMVMRDVIAWNAMIAVYGQNGDGIKALKLFTQFLSERTIPDRITFVAILSACSHAGLIHEGFHHFLYISNHKNVSPTTDHYDCLLDHLGRFGLLDEAEDLLNNMSFRLSPTSWRTMLGACKTHNDIMRSRRIAECILKLDNENAAEYFLALDIHTTAGMLESYYE